MKLTLLIRFIVKDEIPSLEMKHFLVSSVLFILITFIGLSRSSKDVKQACEGPKDVLLCGDVCLKDGKNCTCGNSSFTVKRFEPKSTEVCCSPEGRCFKDTNGKYLFKYGDVYTFLKIFLCLGNGYCSDGKVQEQKTLCNGLCPLTIGWMVSIPCKNNITGVIQCSDDVPPNFVCRGISTNVCPE